MRVNFSNVNITWPPYSNASQRGFRWFRGQQQPVVKPEEKPLPDNWLGRYLENLLK